MGFRDLQRFENARARLDAFKAWQALSPDARQAAYEAVSPPAQRVKTAYLPSYVSPFGTAANSMVYLQTHIPSAQQSGAGDTVAVSVRNVVLPYHWGANGHAAVPDNAAQLNPKKFKFAKLTLTQKIPSTTRVSSRITKALYYKPASNSVSAPFGQATAGQDEATVIAAIKASTAFTTFIDTGGQKNTYKITPEGI